MWCSCGCADGKAVALHIDAAVAAAALVHADCPLAAAAAQHLTRPCCCLASASHMAELGRCCGCCGGETGGRSCALPGRITGERWPRGPADHPPWSGTSAAIARGATGGVPGNLGAPDWLGPADLRSHTRSAQHASAGSLLQQLAKCLCCGERHLMPACGPAVRCCADRGHRAPDPAPAAGTSLTRTRA